MEDLFNIDGWSSVSQEKQGPARILLVDDDKFDRTFIMDCLAPRKMNVHEASNGDEAIEMVTENFYDLVLSDIYMPGINGIELIKKIREIDENLQVILFTGHADLATAIEAVKLGVFDYIVKPFDPGELTWRVDKAIEKGQRIRLDVEARKTLEEKVNVQSERIRLLFYEAVQALINAIEAKDQYTKGHSIRVTQYAMAYARFVEISFEEASDIQLAARLHDIGKLGINDAILNKTGPLTDEEFEIIKKHPETSYKILNSIMTDPVLRIIRHHHEKWDGNGYPDGLAGELIPHGARIVCLADSYDAMTSSRAYKKAMLPEEAMAEIERCAGTQFDPNMAPGFIEVMRMNRKENGLILEDEVV